MAKYAFKVAHVDVVPNPYPFGINYWRTHEQLTVGGIIYELIADVESEAQITQYWPKAFNIARLPAIEDLVQIYNKRPPTGDEQSIVRVRFNYPKEDPVPHNPIAGAPSWRSTGGLGYHTWVTCVESMEQLRTLWPRAWDISIVAEAMEV